MSIRIARRTAGVAAGLALAIAGLTASPALAANSYNGAAYVNGSGDPLDDWNDEGILSTTTNTRSNATYLWQKVLWANGELAWSDINGVYGQSTVDATKRLQSKHGLHADGIVGKQTFGLGNSLGLSCTCEVNGYHAGQTGLDFALKRDASNGRYQFYDKNGTLRDAGYNYLTAV